MSPGALIIDADQFGRTVARIAHEIVERHSNLDRLALVGIHTRGVPLAERLATHIEEFGGTRPSLGSVDIALYRDDVGVPGRTIPVVGETSFDFPVSERVIVLVDDVLFTGRTIRAAIDAVFDFGRPPLVQLAVLIDRGHRELPIRPDYVGKNLPTSRSERVYVRLKEIDGADGVTLEGEAT
ncbi:MAG: bifunctional pyr operon transcriptional regulator/uracil phosphoribosyltransferase PyrR [Thermoleophilia bacterium]|nr:bifunctional pyr operon transcriptional regulator/uracil phosphoribosyltransferase PyrR [Thermoleophilia bacterium]MDH3724431.1 bifunctional pyr operon transcriptional regulator/uracil phosphoribosyltransferase PyrR [Thermoleophilia bacterium]